MSDTLRKNIDNLCLDMNGIFHEACQKIYKYGKYAELESKVHPRKEPVNDNLRREVFAEVASIINHLIYRVRPSKRVLIMVDGVAGIAKQNQQRQRRYRSMAEENKKFDTCNISTGTEWMDYISKFLDTTLRHQITNSPMWRNLEVVFSNEKVPGEGEHKLISFIRKYGTSDESYVIYGLDADLIFLSLSTQNFFDKPPEFYVLRDNLYVKPEKEPEGEKEPKDNPKGKNMPLLFLTAKGLREFLLQELTWGLACSRKSLIDDFVFLCFFLGNDFLPHSPSVDLVKNGMDILFKAYLNACTKDQEHLIANGTINRKILRSILAEIAKNEKSVLEMSVQIDVFADPLLNKHIKTVDDQKSLDFEKYREEYYRLKFKGADTREVCHHYFRGMEWVFGYYTKGIPSWSWAYPFLYAPFAQEMLKHIDSYVSEPFSLGKPLDPFLQLLNILPPTSKALVPPPLHPITEKFPRSIEIDLSGKKFEWQGIVIVPEIPDFKNEYYKLLPSLEDKDARRNRLGKEFVYTYSSQSHDYSSYYGKFVSRAKVMPLN